MIRKYQYCLCCGNRILTGRKDKKFCSMKCKNAYNNERHDISFDMRQRTMTILNRNYHILSDAIQSCCRNAEIGDLVASGFNPEYATSYKKMDNADEMRCFDIKYNQNAHCIYNIRNVSTLCGDKE